MKNCPNCQNEIPDHAIFCGKCGYKMGQTAFVPSPQPAPVQRPVQPPLKSTPQPTSTKKRLGGWAMALTVVCVVGIGIFFKSLLSPVDRQDRIAFRSNGTLKIINLDGSGLSLMDETLKEQWESRLVSVSPLTGDRVDFTNKGSRVNEEIVLLKPDGSLIQLTNNRSADNFPRFSPNGNSIAFSSDRSGMSEIYAMNADGSGQTQLTFGMDAIAPGWSPDGKKVSFIASDSDEKTWALYVMNMDGSGQTQLTFGVQVGGAPKWSPDGKWIAFSIYNFDNKKSDIFVIRPDGSEMRQLTNDQFDNFNPVWLP